MVKSSTEIKTMHRSLYFGAWPLLIPCLGVFVVTTVASKNVNVGIQSRQQTTDPSIQILQEIHGRTFALSSSLPMTSQLVNSQVSCFTVQLLYSADETDHDVMLWLHYTQVDDELKRVDIINLAVNPGTERSTNNLSLDFEGSSINGLAIKQAEFVHRPNTCYTLKIIKHDGCVLLALSTSSDNSASDNCVPESERGDCNYEDYHASESKKCIEYESIRDNTPNKAPKVNAPNPGKNKPLLETDQQLQQYQDFKRGLLFGSLVLVHSSYENDPFRLCMITYRPNEGPAPDGKLYILTSGLSGDKAMVQTFIPYQLSYHSGPYKAAAMIYRKEAFYETKVIFTDKKQCIILRTPDYHNLCELFTGGRYTNGVLNSICFFVYAVYCQQPATRFTSLGDCWPPAKK